MMLGAPWLALILLCTLVPLLLLLWILRLRRARVRVPAAWLWVEATDDLRAEIPFKRLRWSVLLLLQCIALALLILAAARPRVTTNDGRGGRTVLLIDVSASMHTRDDPGGDRRFEQAIDAARAAVDRLHPGGLLDAGVVIGLTWGMISVFIFCTKALRDDVYEHSPELPEPAAISIRETG